MTTDWLAFRLPSCISSRLVAMMLIFLSWRDRLASWRIRRMLPRKTRICWSPWKRNYLRISLTELPCTRISWTIFREWWRRVRVGQRSSEKRLPSTRTKFCIVPTWIWKVLILPIMIPQLPRRNWWTMTCSVQSSLLPIPLSSSWSSSVRKQQMARVTYTTTSRNWTKMLLMRNSYIMKWTAMPLMRRPRNYSVKRSLWSW